MGACCSTVHESDEDYRYDASGGLTEVFEMKHVLGSGSSGDTWLCKDKSNHKPVAIKLMKRPIPVQIGSNLVREIKIQAQLGKGHLNIVSPQEVVLTDTYLGLVMEFVAGGNLADYILKNVLVKWGSFEEMEGLVMEEDEARYLFRQIVAAMEYCHAHHVVHRDLKMDNTLLDDSEPPRVKVCDFGFARWWQGGDSQMSTITGTPDYMSPQLLEAKMQNTSLRYDGTKTDVWAAGILLVAMLTGRFPFEGTMVDTAADMDDVSAEVWTQQRSTRWCDCHSIQAEVALMTPECRSLIDRMLWLDEAERLSVQEIKAHPWFVHPLSSKYQQAWDELQQEQRALDAEMLSRGATSKARDAALKQMIHAAATEHEPGAEPTVMRRLSTSAIRIISSSELTLSAQSDGSRYRDQGGRVLSVDL